MVSKTRRIFVFHPFLFAVYSVIGPYSQNASQVPSNWIFRPLVILLLITIAVYACLQIRFKDHEYAGFVSTLFLNWMFMGYLYRFLLERSPFWHTLLGSFSALLLASVPLALLASRWLWRKLSNSRIITTFLNVASLSLVVYPLWITTGIFYTGNAQLKSIKDQQSQFKVSLAKPSASAPDIYLIIVDGYGRADVLQDLYGYDNTQFMTFLRDKGFYIADQAAANYPQTQLSLSSMMNLQYLSPYVQGFGATNDHTALYELLQHPILRQLLKDQGYKFVALPSVTLITQIRDADVYFNLTASDINEFEAFLLSSTVAGVAADSWGMDLPVMGYELHHKYIVFSLDKLREVPEIPGPKFVFAHIVVPHPPFIFDRDGNFVRPAGPYIMWDASLFPGTKAEYRKGYTDQVTFLNRQLTEIISDILARSANPPIIILQGDHGPGAFYNVLALDHSCLYERFSILNAYYFPDGDYRLLYPSITPVNSFRVVLDQYFGAQLSLLDDRSYFASWSSPYLYTDVTDQIPLSCNISVEGMH